MINCSSNNLEEQENSIGICYVCEQYYDMKNLVKINDFLLICNGCLQDIENMEF